MIISHKHRYVYISVPKAASQTMFRVLSEHYDGERYGGMHENQIPPMARDYFKFTVVRNPYRRALRLWWSTCRGDDDEFRRKDRYGMRLGCPDPDNFEAFMRWLPSASKDPMMAPSWPLMNTMTEQLEPVAGPDRFLLVRSRRWGLGVSWSDVLWIIVLEELNQCFWLLPFVGPKDGVQLFDGNGLPQLNDRPNSRDYQISESEKYAIRAWCIEDFVNFGYVT